MINDQMEALYLKYHRELYLYAFSLCRDHHLAQDLVSDTFFKAYLSLDEVDYFKYWLFRVCKNLYLDFLKRDRVYSSEDIAEGALSHEETPLDILIQSEKRKDLYHAIINLNESYKEILMLYYFCGFSLKEISGSKNMTEGAAKTMLFRARKKLKREMGGEHEL